MEASLRLSLSSYEMSQRMCTSCGRALPEQAKKCHPCNNSNLPPKYCTSETRVAEYFAILRKVELWPTLQPFGECSVSEIIFRISCAQKDLKHTCSADSHCPLFLKLNGLMEKARRIERNVYGFCLRCIREDEEWEGDKRCIHGNG